MKATYKIINDDGGFRMTRKTQGKDEITAEIERLKKELKDLPSGDYKNGVFYVLEEELTPFINSLPAEQPSGDLEKEIDKQWNEEYRPYDSGYTIAELSLSDYRETARHFAQWQKEQMMKSAIDAKIVNDEMSGCVVDCEQGCLVLAPNTYPIGQKLKILIIKEDEQ